MGIDYTTQRNQELNIGSDKIVLLKSSLLVFFPKIGRYYQAICLNNGFIGPRCPNNLNSICQIQHVEIPWDYLHEWDGKNVYKCPCG